MECRMQTLPIQVTLIPVGKRILRLPQVVARVGLSRASIYKYITEGAFPRPIPIGLRARGWLEEDITAWIDARIHMARSID